MDETQQLHVQTALLLCQAVESKDPLEFLKSRSQLHNTGEVYIREASNCNYVMAVSDNRVTTSDNRNLATKLEPTVYVAFKNSVPDQIICPGDSFSCFFMGQTEHSMYSVEGARLHQVVELLIKELPMETFMSILGQGFQLILTGLQLGGMVAHAWASKLLLQLKQEIHLAQQMKINVSGLALAIDKVVSYSFGAPLFANSALSQALKHHDVQKQLNTIMKVGDASLQFLTLCSNMCCALPVSREPSESILQARSQVASEGRQLDQEQEPLYPLNWAIIRSPQFLAVQKWAQTISEQLAKNKSRSRFHFVSRPFDVSDIKAEATSPTRNSELIDKAKSMRDGIPGIEKGNEERQSGDAQTSSRSSSGKVISPTASGSFIEEGGSGKSQGRSSNHRLSTLEDENKTSSLKRNGNADRTSPGANLLNPRMEAAAHDVAPSADSHSNRRGLPLSPTKGPSNALSAIAAAKLHASNLAARVIKARGTKATPTTDKGLPPLPSGISALREPLLEVLRVGNDCEDLYTPTGHFWCLEHAQKLGEGKVAHGSANGFNEVNVTLKQIPTEHVAGRLTNWLSDSNTGLVDCWEYALEEYERDLMEVFPWVSFSALARASKDQYIDRDKLIRVGKAGVGFS